MSIKIFKDKLCWITGASSGIGKAIAIELASKQAKLVLSSRNTAELEQVGKQCLQYTDFCKILPFDLEQPAEVDRKSVV